MENKSLIENSNSQKNLSPIINVPTPEEIKSRIDIPKILFLNIIGTIPYVDEILKDMISENLGNIETNKIMKSIEFIKEKMYNIGEDYINKEWFKTEEALSVLKNIFEKIIIEHDVNKLKYISELYVISGTKKFFNDPNKFAVLRVLSELTASQKEVFEIVCSTPDKSRDIFGEYDSAHQNMTAKFFEDIEKNVPEKLFNFNNRLVC
jgi:hypothetical protein